MRIKFEYRDLRKGEQYCIHVVDLGEHFQMRTGLHQESQFRCRFPLSSLSQETSPRSQGQEDEEEEESEYYEFGEDGDDFLHGDDVVELESMLWQVR